MNTSAGGPSLYVLAVTVEYSALATPFTSTDGPGVKSDSFFQDFSVRLLKLGLKPPLPTQTHPTSLKHVFSYWSHEDIMDTVRVYD